MLPELALVAFLQASSSAIATDCDRLAAGPDDPHRVAAAVELNEIDREAALVACAGAVGREPGKPRTLYQLGRSLRAAGREQEARQAWRRAAAHGYEAALFDLGVLYIEAYGGMRGEAAEAYELFRRAADAGHAGSQTAIGLMHERGWGAQHAFGEAAAWYTRAVAGGNTLAMLLLANLYERGWGVPADPLRAAALVAKVRASGIPPSMIALGRAFAVGRL